MNGECVKKWNSEYFANTAIFAPLENYIPFLTGFSDWPDLRDYQAIFDCFSKQQSTSLGSPLRFVEQSSTQHAYEDQYEPRIFLKGEVQTRSHNWHDFFQVLVWTSFPATKFLLNQLHYAASKERRALNQGSRTPLENALTLFDECGAIILSSDKHDLALVRQFRWKTLFWEQRQQTIQRFRCYLFGHALYEKALAPYVGMTANCILFTIEDSFYSQPVSLQLATLDKMLVAHISNQAGLQRPSDLQPVPVLGVPGWHTDNAHESFYDNQSYFRSGRGNNRS